MGISWRPPANSLLFWCARWDAWRVWCHRCMSDVSQRLMSLADSADWFTVGVCVQCRQCLWGSVKARLCAALPVGQDSSSFNRHMSVDSVNSYNSFSSQQTTTTDVTDGADRKKKRKNWVRCTTVLSLCARSVPQFTCHSVVNRSRIELIIADTRVT